MAHKQKRKGNPNRNSVSKTHANQSTPILVEKEQNLLTQRKEDNIIMYIISSPFFALVFGAILSVALFYLSSYDMKPLYTYSDPREIIKDSIPKLNISLEENKSEKVFELEVVFWNGGNKEIDKSCFSQDHPLQIDVPDEIKILNYRIIKTSRSTLQFSDSSNNHEKAIRLSIKGDEALEKNDGAIIQFYYIGLLKNHFKVSGRIKGAKDGFEYKDWDNSFKRYITTANMLGILNIAFMSIIGIVMYYTEIKRYREKLSNNLYFASFCFFPVIGLNIYFYSLFIFGPSWVL